MRVLKKRVYWYLTNLKDAVPIGELHFQFKPKLSHMLKVSVYVNVHIQYIPHSNLFPATFEEQVITYDRKYQPQRQDIADTAYLSHNPLHSGH